MNTKFRNHFLGIVKSMCNPCAKQGVEQGDEQTQIDGTDKYCHAPTNTAAVDMNVLTSTEDSKVEC